MGYRLCIFDLDGTLIDTSGDINNAANDMLSHFGLEKIDKDQTIQYVGDGIRKFVERCVDSKTVDIEKAVSFFKEAYFARKVETTRPYSGIVGVLEEITGRHLSVLTNKSYDISKAIIDELGLSHYFEYIVGGDTLERKKPFPDGIEHILRKSGVSKNETLMIGDGKNDILSAKEAKITSVYVSYGFTKTEQILHLEPDHIVDKPSDLSEICR
jgi:phosphoglycolate phosphatase